MPRIPPHTLTRALRLSPHIATLLRECRDLPSALNELRWIREHVAAHPHKAFDVENPLTTELRIASLCRRRGRGEPLQYVLGTVPFGELEMLCRPGVLIPRPEPEAYTAHLAHLLLTTPLLPPSTKAKPLAILDLCTGTGCIALLLHALLRAYRSTTIHGVDISPAAVQLARRNADHNHFNPTESLTFSQGDIFSDAWLGEQQGRCDVLVCNPPYVSSWGFAHQTARSVRNYEPKLAQVPSALYSKVGHDKNDGRRTEDVFYERLLDVGARLGARVMLFEVGDLAQALRVVTMAWGHQGLSAKGEVKVEVWRDWPDVAPLEDEETSRKVMIGQEEREVRVKGSGHGRSVFIQCS